MVFISDSGKFPESGGFRRNLVKWGESMSRLDKKARN